MKKILFIVNDPSYFISHRMPIGVTLLRKGFSVHVASPGQCPSVLLDNGFIYHRLKMSRKGSNPIAETMSIWELVRLFKQIKPDLVHLVTIKPYLYGGIAARISGVPSVVSAVAGLGLVFSQNTVKSKFLRIILYQFYNLAFGHKNQTTIFQNPNDRDLLVKWGILSKDKTVVIRGAGVDLAQYPFCDEPSGVPVITFAGRLLRDKGVEEFVEASRLLRARGVKVFFWLIGEPDSGNSNSVTTKQLDEWQKLDLIKYFSYRSDIASLFSQSNMISLPSYYGEGLPKVLVEAAACGRAVITTDHPGCRDAIGPNVTGVLVPIRNVIALADAIEDLINNPEKRKQLGQAGRVLAEKEFSIEKIIDEHMKIYNELFNVVRSD